MSGAYARAVRLNEWRWEVFCADCHKSIGTMTGEILSAAIIRSANRGGVKCPECRKLSCNVCGLQPDDPQGVIETGKCWFCVRDNVAELPSKETEAYIEVTLV